MRGWKHKGLLFNAAVEAREVMYNHYSPGGFDPPCGIASYAYYVPCGRVYSYGYPITPDNKLMVGVAPDFNKTDEHHWLFRHKLPPPVVVDGTVAVLASPHCYNYYHWTVDVIPRFRHLMDESPDYYYVNSNLPFQKEWLGLLGISPDRVICASRYSHVQADTLLIPPVRPCHPVYADLMYLRSFFSAPNQPWRRVYVPRGKSRFRRVTNEKSLMKFLEPRGFTTFDGGSVSMQAETFGKAHLVLAAHGAALANLVFCPPGTEVVEMFPAGYSTGGCYKDICELLELKHTRLVFGRGRHQHRIWQNIRVDMDELALHIPMREDCMGQ